MSQHHKEARFNPKLRTDMTPQQIAEMFDDFADDYDEEVLEKGLRAHELVGDFLATTYPESDRSSLKVLDVGAGTGFVGLKLKALGFTYVDALDPAQKMLDVAKTRNVYRRLICAFMDKNRVEEIETDFYDCITATAAFNEGLVPCNAFAQMIRIVKPGGRIVFTIPQKNINNAVEYRDRLLPLIDKLAAEGAWEVTAIPLADGQLAKSLGPGILYSLKVNVSEKYFEI
ncbi:demethylmenaquinone methyltransferase-like [Haliotis rufescens]|uniref:demethylmenaquinone methyltransferase-like n=1 Tax=Haliotis rufescens TaxID=6454 RepID=UPI00201EBF43|nr:demethylmenaquinone methyltransferase-like [Haliotis rufescens]